jgi:hypothetical protein
LAFNLICFEFMINLPTLTYLPGNRIYKQVQLIGH